MGRKRIVKKIEEPVVRGVSWVVLLSIIAALAVGTLGVYLRVGWHDFIQFDDPEYVVDNVHIRDLTTQTSQSIAWAFDTDGHCSNWHPLTWISHMVDYHFFTLEHPGGHHMVNVLLHILSTILLFLALYKMTGYVWRAAFVAALFAIHPAHMESVAWVAERKDVLSTVFWMLVMLLYAHYVRSRGWKNVVLYIGIIIAFGIGLLAKSMLVSLPLVLLLLDWWPLKRMAPIVVGKNQVKQRWPMVIAEKLPLFALSYLASRMTVWAQWHGGAMASTSLTWQMRLDNAVVAIMNYIGKLFWPSPLSIVYPHPGEGLPVPAVVASYIGVAAISIIIFAVLKGRNYLRIGWMWFLVTLIPVIGLVQVGEQGMADRYTYVPYIGLFIALAWGIPELLEKRNLNKPVMLGAAAGVAIAALAGSTVYQLGYWKNSDTLFRHAIAVTGPNITAQINLGAYLEKQGHRDEAIEHYKAALEINPSHVRSLNLLGTAYARDGRLNEALAEYQKALDISEDPLVENNIGSILNDLNRPKEAVPHLQQAMAMRPDLVNAYNNLGNSYRMLGRYDEAIGLYNQALSVNQYSADAYANRGFAHAFKGEFTEAVNDYKQGLALGPTLIYLHARLGAAYFFLGRYQDSLAELEEAQRLGMPVDPRLLADVKSKLGGAH